MNAMQSTFLWGVAAFAVITIVVSAWLRAVGKDSDQVVETLFIGGFLAASWPISIPMIAGFALAYLLWCGLVKVFEKTAGKKTTEPHSPPARRRVSADLVDPVEEAERMADEILKREELP
jgi:hypothetical protein